MKTRLRNGCTLYHESHGAGEPLVLIAGTGCDHQYWRLQVAEYQKSHRVIVLDTRGAGQSTVSPDPGSYSSELLADDLAELLAALRVDAAHVAGHSLGSCIAQQLALRHPSLVRSLQLHATWAHADAWLQRAFIGTTRYPLALGDKHETFRTVSMWMLSPEYLNTRAPERVADMVVSCLIRNEHLQANEGMLGHLAADAAHDTREDLDRIGVPTLVTAGETDLLIPARYGEAVAQAIPQAQFHLFRGPRSSHAYNWELAEEFNDVTSHFLRKVIR
jgi:pimeloyl-ACP methyl ester carboxylesterase